MKKYIIKIFLEYFGLGLTIGYSVIWPLSRGLDLTQVAILQSCIFITSLLFEVPTGIWADRYGKKNSITFGLLFNALGFLTITFAHTFIIFFVGSILIGISRAFSSGAEEAYTNEVFAEDDERKYKKIFSNIAIVSEIGIFLGSISASLITIRLGVQSVFLFASVSIFFSLIYLIIFLPSEKFTKNDSKSFIVNDPRRIKDEVFKYKKFLLVFISLSILLESARVVWQPHLIEVGWSQANLGFIFAGLRVFSIFGSFMARKLSIKSLRSIYISGIFGGLFLVIFATGTKYLAFFAIGSYLFMENYFQLHQSNYLLRIAIQKDTRSTFLSAANLFRNILMAITSPLLIFIVANVGIYAAMLLLFFSKLFSVLILKIEQRNIIYSDKVV